jgi:hypothetical protein
LFHVKRGSPMTPDMPAQRIYSATAEKVLPRKSVGCNEAADRSQWGTFVAKSELSSLGKKVGLIPVRLTNRI